MTRIGASPWPAFRCGVSDRRGMQSKPVRPAFFMRRANGDARQDGRVRNVLRLQCDRRNNPGNELLIGLCGRHHE
ncbi:hypothetical protein [Burkholderia sp. MSHR3999]|uniref:hypothetical protein n=1 Tax=Burkholderia sp. MSHR3999 TaxID=1542965 RepID=UPI000A4E6915|nr:hypothetical protein [Burkholderia sp. MSHR3999]